MSTFIDGNTDVEKLTSLNTKTYKEQGIWFLNGYFEKLGEEKLGEKVYAFVAKMSELDKEKGDEGNQLDEFQAHRFLEHFGETLTVIDMRKWLKEIDLDSNRCVSLIEFLLYRYKDNVTVSELVNAPQGDETEVNKATSLLEEANQALAIAKEGADLAKKSEAIAKKSANVAKTAEEACKSSAEDARVAHEAAETSESNAKTSESNAKTSESNAVKTEQEAESTEVGAKSKEELSTISEKEARDAEFIALADSDKAESASKLATAADNETKRCLADLKREEDDYNGKIAQFEAISTDPALGIVKKNVAKNQLAQLKCEDPLPLRRAKISQTAAVRKSDIAAKQALNAEIAAKKTLKTASDARAKAESELAVAFQARSDAGTALKLAVQSRKEAAKALEASVQSRKEAETALELAIESKMEAEVTLEASVKAREEADYALESSVNARKDAETKLGNAETAFETAETFLDEMQNKVGSPKGALWWIDRNLLEARKYLPKRAGGIARK